MSAMSAFTRVLPRAEQQIEQMEEVEVVEEEVEVVAGEVEVFVDAEDIELEETEGGDGVTLTELEGIVIRSAETRPDSWPKNKRRSPPSPTPTELGEDSGEEGREFVYPKVTLKFKGKIEGTRTRSKEPTKAKRREHRSVAQTATELQAVETLDDATGPTTKGHTTPGLRNGAELGDAMDQAYWQAHERFAKCPGGVWLHEAVKPGFAHSSVAMRDTCKAAHHVLMATPADCPFHMGETDIDYMKYLRTAVVGYKKRLEKGMGFASHRRVQGLRKARDSESEEEEQEEQEEAEEVQVIDGVEVGQPGPSSVQTMMQMQKDLHDQFEELKKQRELLASMQEQQQQQEESVRHQNLQTFSHHGSFDGVLMVAPVPETQEEACSAANEVRNYLTTMPLDKQTKAHKAALRLAKENPQNQKTMHAWMFAMQQGPLGRHKAYTVKIAIILVLNPSKSCTWAYTQVGSRISHASTVLSMAYSLRMHPFTRSELEQARDTLPNMAEDVPSVPTSKASEKWTSAEETRRRAAASLAEAFGMAPRAPAPTPTSPQFNAASLQVMQAAAHARTIPPAGIDLTCDETPAPAAAPPAAAVVPAAAVRGTAAALESLGTPITPAEFVVLKKRHPELYPEIGAIARRDDMSDVQKKLTIMRLVQGKGAEDDKGTAAAANAEATSSDEPVITKEVYRDAFGNRVVEEAPTPASQDGDSWTKEEDDRLRKVHAANRTPTGYHSWPPILKAFPGRSEGSVRNRWQRLKEEDDYAREQEQKRFGQTIVQPALAPAPAPAVADADVTVMSLVQDIGGLEAHAQRLAGGTGCGGPCQPSFMYVRGSASEIVKKAWNVRPGEAPTEWRRRRMTAAVTAKWDPSGPPEQAEQQRTLFAIANKREPFDAKAKLKPSLSLKLPNGSERKNPNNESPQQFSHTFTIPIPYARAGDLVAVVLNDDFSIPDEDFFSARSKFNATVPASYGMESKRDGAPLKLQFPITCWHKRRDPESGELMWVFTDYGIHASVVGVSVRTACWVPPEGSKAGQESCRYLLYPDHVVVHPETTTVVWPHDVYQCLKLPLKECLAYPKAWFNDTINQRKATYLREKGPSAAAPAPAAVENDLTVPLTADTSSPIEDVRVWYYLNCALLFGAVQEDKTLTFYQRRRISECSYRHCERNSTKPLDEVWKAACITITSVVGSARLRKAHALLVQRGQEGLLGRVRFHHTALNQFKLEKGRAVAAGMFMHDYPLQATWCEPLWNLMTEKQKKVFITGRKPSVEAANAVLSTLIG